LLQDRVPLLPQVFSGSEHPEAGQSFIPGRVTVTDDVVAVVAAGVPPLKTA